ncbi:hypothetical protein JJL56_01600 [Azospirillum sp. YIM DDC1]|uniref:Uncharacterized protein n=1 Tax=Azospirillum aestuarii TaxID=2802052 RepID=A0ABS1HT36_9PROT|nr:hypothetical protein [Azospirillum aestuarii]MBK4717557.1 hypothetical protein [Azospirillum aestuarii]
MIRMAVQVLFIAENGERDVHGVARLDRGDLVLETLGLSLAEAGRDGGFHREGAVITRPCG